MKLLIVISHLYMGGFSKSLINFLHCMKAHSEVEITLLMLENCPTTLERQLPEQVQILRMDLQYSDTTRGKLALEYHHYKYVFFEMLYKHIKKVPFPNRYVREFAQAKIRDRAQRVTNDFSFAAAYDCVISWEEDFCNYILATKIPVHHKIGFIHPNYRDAGFAKQIDRPFYKKLDRLVVVSEECAQTLKKEFPEMKDKIVCIPNRLSLSYYIVLAREYAPSYDAESLNLLTVAGVTDRVKATFRVVPLVKRLRASDIPVKWYLIGDGPDMAELKRRIYEAGLENSIICLGAMDNPCPYLANADLYVQQSHYEGRPVSVDEAIILNTPALLTNYSSAKEQVEPGVTGWIVEDDEEAIYQQLKILLEHPDMLRQAREALKQRSNESFEDCTPMLNMLREVCGET